MLYRVLIVKIVEEFIDVIVTSFWPKEIVKRDYKISYHNCFFFNNSSVRIFDSEGLKQQMFN